MRINIELVDENEIIDFWENLGFLEGLTDDKKKYTALTYQKGSKLIMECGDKYKKIDFLLYPIIRRLIDGVYDDNDIKYCFRGPEEYHNDKREYIVKNFDVKIVADKFNKTYYKLLNVVRLMNDGDDIDAEAETVFLFCKIILPSICKKVGRSEVFKKSTGEIILFGPPK